MRTLPKITVVTPNFNGSRYIERTIQSVLNQDYPALEYFVVDDGSTDESVEIIRKYAGALSWWCTQPNAGQANALARGFAQATGDVLCWLNSDDTFLPGALQAVGEFFSEHPEAEVVNGAAYRSDEDDRPIRRFSECTYTLGVRATARRFLFYGQDGVYQQATFWRRNAYTAVGGLRDFRFAMDLDLFVRLAMRQRFHVIPQYLACFRAHPTSKSYTIDHVRRADVQSIKRDYGVLETSPVARMALYAWYRCLSLCRKAMLHTRMLCGLERFPTAAGNVSETLLKA